MKVRCGGGEGLTGRSVLHQERRGSEEVSEPQNKQTHIHTVKTNR